MAKLVRRNITRFGMLLGVLYLFAKFNDLIPALLKVGYRVTASLAFGPGRSVLQKYPLP